MRQQRLTVESQSVSNQSKVIQATGTGTGIRHQADRGHRWSVTDRWPDSDIEQEVHDIAVLNNIVATAGLHQAAVLGFDF